MSQNPQKLAKLNKPPGLYTIFKPNELIKAKKFNMNFIEKRVYYEILNYNHSKNPEQTVYEIPYEVILNPNDALTGNRKTNAKRISESLQKRIFFFDSSFMKREFGDDTEASMNPFPEVNCYDDHFKVHLWHRFKKILTLVGLGFTKGDLDTLRAFKHEITDEFYWLIRQRQAWGDTWTVDLEELKEKIGLAGRYELWQNFKTKVLDPAKQDCEGTWVEFSYKPIRKGKGGAVTQLIFYLKNGPKQEKDAPAGEDYIWEENLLRYGVDPIKVKEIRQRVKINQEGVSKEKKIAFLWDSDYVRFSIEAMVSELKEKRKSKEKKQIANTGGFLYAGLIDGFWIEYVEFRKKKINSEVQQNLSFDTPAAPVQEKSVPKKITLAANDNPVVNVLTEDELPEWRELHSVSPMKDKTFDEFMNHSNYFLVEGKWVR